ncbi:MAG: PAS domain S-box protein [Gammaproteobacteria bacterium]|nr:PAS domain S-box protein [Gammaproteobacteria bacterium]
MNRTGQGVVVIFGFIAIIIMTLLHNQQLSELTVSFKQEEGIHVEHIMTSVEREIELIELEVAGVLHRIARQHTTSDIDVNTIATTVEHDKALREEIARLQVDILLSDIIVTQYEGRFISRAMLSVKPYTFDNVHIQKHYEWLSQYGAGLDVKDQSEIISTTSDQRLNHLYYSTFIDNQMADVAPIMATFIIDIDQLQGTLLKGYYLQFDEVKYISGNIIQYLNFSSARNVGEIYEFNDVIGSRKLWGRWVVGTDDEWRGANKMAFAIMDKNYKVNVLLLIIFIAALIMMFELLNRSNKLRNVSNQKLMEKIAQKESDLSESKECNQAINEDLKKSELKMHSIINASTDGVVICDSHAVITDINQAIKELFGYSEDDVLEKGIGFLFPDYSPKDSHSDSYSEFSTDSTPSKFLETNAISKNNVFLEVELYVTCVKISDNDVYTIIVRDISDRVKKQNKIRDVQENLRAVINNIAEGIITSDERGNILTFNPAAENIFGWKASEMLGENISTLMNIQDKEAHDGYLNKYIQSRNRRILGVGPRDVIGIKKNGDSFHMELATSEMFSDKNRVFIAIFRDVTERKMIEKNMHLSYSELESVVDSHTDDLTKVNKELVRARDEALVAARSKAEFLAMMSHEIRTPINGVLGMLNLVRDTELNSEQQDYIESAYSSGEILLALLNDVLDLSKMEAGCMTLDCNDFDLYQLVEAAVSITSKTLHNPDIEVACAISGKIPKYVYGDGGRLRQVLSNLLSNAVKFTERGGILVTVSLDSMASDHFILNFDVADTGIGIEAIDSEMIFDEFIQADNSERRNYGGTGLGLSISKRFVELMGGEISVTSEPGKGSCFSFTVDVTRGGCDIESSPIELERVFVLSEHNTTNKALLIQLDDWQLPVKQITADEIIAGFSGELTAEKSILIVDLDRQQYDDFERYVQGIIKTVVKVKLKCLFVEIDDFCFSPFIDRSLDRDIGFISRPVLPDKLQSSIKWLLKGEGEKTYQRDKIIVDTKNDIVVEHEKESASVLVAEDNLVNQKVVISILKKLGVSADIANNGREALLALSNPEHNYRLVLMDCQMPGVDGYAAARQQRRLEKDNPDIKRIPIVAMTAHALPGDREKCLDAGMDDYITKPINLEVVRKVIEGWS